MTIISRALVGLLGFVKSKNSCDFEKSSSVGGSLEAKNSKLAVIWKKKFDNIGANGKKKT